MQDANLLPLEVALETGDLDQASVAGHGARAGQAPCLTLVPDATADDARADHFVRRDGKTFAGTHLIIEVVGGTGLDDEARIEHAFRECVRVCGATLLSFHAHKFTPQGVSAVAVLAESHISVHTWPEIGYGAFDVFMCGDTDPWRAADVLAQVFETGDVRVKELLRGEGLIEAAP